MSAPTEIRVSSLPRALVASGAEVFVEWAGAIHPYRWPAGPYQRWKDDRPRHRDWATMAPAAADFESRVACKREGDK